MKKQKSKSDASTSTAPDRATGAAELRLRASAEAISEKTIENAMSGDLIAGKLVLDKVLRKPGERRISFPLRPILNRRDAELAMFDVLNAAAQGRMTPAEAHVIIKQLVAFIGPHSPADGVVAKECSKDDIAALVDINMRLVGERLKELTTPIEKSVRPEAAAAIDQPETEHTSSSDSGAPRGGTAAAEARLQNAAQEIAGVVIDMAVEGDVAAEKLALDIVLPKPADRTIQFPIRRIAGKEDAVASKADLLRAIAEARISPAEAEAFLRLLRDVIRAPKVELPDSEQIDQVVRQTVIPEMMRLVAARERDQPGGEKVTPYEIWQELGRKRRARRLNPVRILDGGEEPQLGANWSEIKERAAPRRSRSQQESDDTASANFQSPISDDEEGDDW